MSDLGRFWPRWLSDELRTRLEAAYDDPGRGYHDRRHLTEVLEHVDELMEADDPAREAVLLAAWFHDAVYEGSAEDEERSALLAEQALEGARAALAAEVGRLVRLTRTHRPADDDVPGLVLCDADLAILGADEDRYASYVRGVRSEYAHVPDADFAAGRSSVLRDLLAKPALFATPVARERWEERARRNVERELRELVGPLGSERHRDER
jgi:predicted metal-dependent HD superfamily phosphohydrolase